MTGSIFQSPDAAEAAFYAAFAATDLTLMASVWLNTDDAQCVHPGGDLLQGYAAVLHSWQSILSATEAPTIRFRLLNRLESDGLSVHIVEEGIGPAGEVSDLTRVLATNTYLRTNRGWHLVMHHATLPLVESVDSTPSAKAGDRIH
ncbi:MAG: nuclear transport factor 2 family protein [Thiohalocapsa sp.]